jgi:3-oxoacyl-[acyl-carrier protein] reductase
MSFKDKIVIVTGSGRGIGKETVKQFAYEGAKVVISDIHEENAEITKNEIIAFGGEAVTFIGDVSDSQDSQELILKAIDSFGTVDILVNNAGTLSDNLIGKMEIDEWDKVLNVCLRSCFLCTKYASEYMIEKQYGKVVNISSRAYLGNPGQANYSSAKAGVIGFTKAMAKELGKYSINVNAIAPGLIETEGLTSHPKYLMIKERAEKAAPLRRLGHTEDVANAILFLASDKSSYITGDVLHVTGGRFS